MQEPESNSNLHGLPLIVTLMTLGVSFTNDFTLGTKIDSNWFLMGLSRRLRFESYFIDFSWELALRCEVRSQRRSSLNDSSLFDYFGRFPPGVFPRGV